MNKSFKLHLHICSLNSFSYPHPEMSLLKNNLGLEMDLRQVLSLYFCLLSVLASIHFQCVSPGFRMFIWPISFFCSRTVER